MNLIGTPDHADAVAAAVASEIGHVNTLMAEQEHPEWVNVQVCYRLEGVDTTFREDILKQQAPEVPELLSQLAQHVRLTYGQMTIEVITGNSNRRRFLTFDTAAIVYVEVLSEPFVPEQNQDDERRRNLRGHGTRNLVGDEVLNER